MQTIELVFVTNFQNKSYDLIDTRFAINMFKERDTHFHASFLSPYMYVRYNQIVNLSYGCT